MNFEHEYLVKGRSLKRGNSIKYLMNLNLIERFHMTSPQPLLVFQNNETAAMLMHETNPVGVELLCYVNTSSCFKICLRTGHVSENALFKWSLVTPFSDKSTLATQINGIKKA